MGPNGHAAGVLSRRHGSAETVFVIISVEKRQCCWRMFTASWCCRYQAGSRLARIRNCPSYRISVRALARRWCCRKRFRRTRAAHVSDAATQRGGNERESPALSQWPRRDSTACSTCRSPSRLRIPGRHHSHHAARLVHSFLNNASLVASWAHIA
jgi:hypothetical protein